MSGSDDGLADGVCRTAGRGRRTRGRLGRHGDGRLEGGGFLFAGEALELGAIRVLDAGFRGLAGHLQVIERRLRFGLVGAAAIVHAGVVDQAVLLLLTLLDRAVRQAGDLHLDRVARQHDVGLPHPERVDAVPDVRERLVHDVAGRAFRRGEDHRDAALEVQAQGGLQGTGGETDQGPHDEQRHHGDREPQAAGSLHASSEPFTTSRNRASSISAARRHSCILPRKISKYSITWLIWVSMVSSRLTVRASESTRRNDCSTA